MELELKTLWAVISVLIGCGAFLPYLRDVLRQNTKPHLYTWLIWCITQGTAVVALWHGNGGWGAISFTIGTGFVFLITLLSLKYGARNITRGDTFVLVLALTAVLVWWQLENPLLAVFMVSAIDVLGYIPSLRKSIIDPWSETIWTWIAFSIGNIFAILALSEYNFLTLTYIVSISFANLILAGICIYFRHKTPKIQLH